MKNEFLYAAIADTQGTIRSIDVRAGFLFLILFLPLSLIDKLWTIYGFPPKLTCVMTVWVVADLIIWAAAIVALFRCVVAIDNPANHIAGAPGSDAFYGGSLFDLKFQHIFGNFPALSSRTVDDEAQALPSDGSAVEKELIFEKMKLAYIRSVKLLRFTAAAWLTLAWLVLSGALAIYSRVFA